MNGVHRTVKRSLVKAVTYRAVIVVLDVTVIYLLTGRTDIAIGFTIISNLYTTAAYFLHERLWNKIHWGTEAGTTPPQ
ncbi:MAG TPA: DUF2061 domain-containing protein [Candidatus Dormibacteraeota bacterium]|nr:DUF2061 domain-containing protein [Candidatus Dormibacteraeota bacterium]